MHFCMHKVCLVCLKVMGCCRLLFPLPPPSLPPFLSLFVRMVCSAWFEGLRGSGSPPLSLTAVRKLNLDDVITLHNRPDRIQLIYERALVENAIDPSLWMSYSAYVNLHANVPT